MSKIDKFFTLLASLVGGWWSFMSGAISIPIGVLALIVGGSAGHWLAVLAFVALWIMTILMALVNYPKFKLSCGKDIDLCATPTEPREFRYFRVRVLTHFVGGIDQCSGNLEKIEKDGAIVFEGDATELPFSKPESRSALSILMKPDIYYYLDVLVVKIEQMQKTIYEISAQNPELLKVRNDIALMATIPRYEYPTDKNGISVFEKTGDYILHVTVSGRGVPTAKARLRFNWTGRAKTSTIEKVK